MADTKPKSLDEAYKRLQEICSIFERGELSLEESLPLSKEALVLGKYVKSRLAEMDNQIKEITSEFDSLITESSHSDPIDEF